ncbi:conserved hypothetical protein [Anaeromyxobacter dehalogenans 2CP-1]|uniref:Tetratricopeptide repeat protein n=1 Tax=Anaeromyxobacter dehalogenans (strain ATCC BAA-258 / DSM 21875 / 2CP-1) TaxID=455488 RepID=B8J742_ANAD2|nr:hypothetical protein [Anaeromyxobacter dehalogenans]ACL65232.1 conserved hypothetical protein [Anaeromyxobacter dehalogenans 2CP-1]
MRRARAAAMALGAVLLSGCAGDYVSRTRAMREAYQAGDHDRAAALAEAEVRRGPERDRLLALLDQGMILHAARRWEESLPVLARAERLAASLEAISVSEEGRALLENERARAYRGEDFEKLMINVVQALNYAALGKDEDALVEVRRVDERLRKMVQEEKKPYQQLAVARYLGGVLWEDSGNPDSAYIDYADALRLAPDLGPLAEPALRLARATGRAEEADALAAARPALGADPLGAEEGQVVLVLEAGLSPEKRSSRQGAGPELLVVPVYVTRPWVRDAATLEAGARRADAVTVTSLEEVAQVHLSERIGRIAAKAVVSTALKGGVAAAVGEATDSEVLGWLTFLALTSTSEADRRSWLSLPAELQVARLRVPAGTHEVVLRSGGKVLRRTVVVRPRRVALLVERRY